MEEPTLDTISQSEFEQAIERNTSWAVEWDGALPADVFFGIWADFQREERQVELREQWPNKARDFTTWLADNLDFKECQPCKRRFPT